MDEVSEPRERPPLAGSEAAMLAAFLDFHRATILRKVAGVGDEDLRRPLVPSGTTLLGMVKHLAYVERRWFRLVFAGEDVPMPDSRGEWRIEPHESTADIIRFYREEVAHSRRIAASAALDERARQPGSEHTLRWVVLHLIEATARHNGNADILREMIDGETGV